MSKAMIRMKTSFAVVMLLSLCVTESWSQHQDDFLNNLYQTYSSTSTPTSYRHYLGRIIEILSPPISPKALVTRGIITHRGGVVIRTDQAAVTVPPDALTEDILITITTPTVRSDTEQAVQKTQMTTHGLKAAADAVEFGPEGTVFSVPVTLVLPYTMPQLTQSGISEDSLRVYYWNPTLSGWQPLNSAVDKANQLVSAQTMHFSLYQVLGSTSGKIAAQAVLSVDSTFMFRDLYAFPNPARGGQKPTIRVQVGLADSVDLHIYDLSGQLVLNVTLNNPQILDDGNGKGPQYTYDYVWDTGGVGSGVYIYVVTAHRSGQSDIKRLKKVGIIK